MSAPNQTINFEVSKEVYDRLVDIAYRCADSAEWTAKFVFEQALEAPEEARQWMIAKRSSQTRGTQNPAGKNYFEAHEEAIREQVGKEHRPALNLADAVRAVL